MLLNPYVTTQTVSLGYLCFYQDEIYRSSGAHKRTLVAGKEELNFEDLQEGNNLLLK